MTLLNQIRKGSKLEFENAKPGEVEEVFNTQKNTDGDVVEMRLYIRHDDNRYTFQTYRRDGRSHQNPDHDIIKIA